MNNKISIIIPCHNDGKYLNESVNSAINQTYINKELIIVNDNSTDLLTLKILNRYKSEYKNIHVLNNKKRGLSSARNTGINYATGKYILPLDADDKIDPNYITEAVDILQKNPDIKVCTARVRFFGLRNNIWPQPSSTYSNIVTEECKILPSSVFYREDWERVSGYDENLTLGKEDMVFWLDILKNGGKVATIPKIYIFYRVKPNSMSALTRSNPTEDEKQALMYASRPEIFQRHTLDFMKLCANYRQEKAQRTCLISWKLFSPFFKLEWYFRQKIKKLFGRS